MISGRNVAASVDHKDISLSCMVSLQGKLNQNGGVFVLFVWGVVFCLSPIWLLYPWQIYTCVVEYAPYQKSPVDNFRLCHWQSSCYRLHVSCDTWLCVSCDTGLPVAKQGIFMLTKAVLTQLITLNECNQLKRVSLGSSRSPANGKSCWREAAALNQFCVLKSVFSLWCYSTKPSSIELWICQLYIDYCVVLLLPLTISACGWIQESVSTAGGKPASLTML